MIRIATVLLLAAPLPAETFAWPLRVLDARGRPHARCKVSLVLAPESPRFGHRSTSFHGYFGVTPSDYIFRIGGARTDGKGRVTLRFRMRNPRQRPRKGMHLWLRVEGVGREHLTEVELPNLCVAPKEPREVRTRPMTSLALKLDPPLAGNWLLSHASGLVVRPRGNGAGRVLAFPALPPGRYQLHYSPIPEGGNHNLWLFHCRSGAIPLQVEEGGGVGNIATRGLRPGRLLLRLRTWQGAARGFEAHLHLDEKRRKTSIRLGNTDLSGRIPAIQLLPGRYKVTVKNIRYNVNFPETLSVMIRPGLNRPVDATLATGGVRIRLVDPRGEPLKGKKLPRNLVISLYIPTSRTRVFHPPRKSWQEGRGELVLRGLPPGTAVLARPGRTWNPLMPGMVHLATIRKEDFFTTHLVWSGRE